MEQTNLEQTLLRQLTEPLRLDEIRAANPETGKQEIFAALDTLLADGRIMKNKKNRYAVPEHFGCRTGVFLATERTFSFVAPDQKDENGDIFIPPNRDGGAWEGDRVLVRLSERRGGKGRTEGEVIRILARRERDLTGALTRRGDRYYVQPRSKKYPEIEVDHHDLGDAKEGDCVAVSVQYRGSGKVPPQGKVTAALGAMGTMGAAIGAILHENNIYDRFPDEVLQQADAIPQQVDCAAAGKRLDLRDKLIFTIDGDDAKDFDDAVSLEALPNGHLLLGVHIADVSHYVTPGSPLDAEAFRRGTSVYFPGHVVPMLPFALSNGICSLNPDVDRLAFSALMELDGDGRRHGAKFGKSIIRSKARMTYHNVNKILEGDPALCAQYDFLTDTITRMNALAKTLHARRLQRGALELDIPESEIIVGEDGMPTEISWRERGESERLIEEFMLLANEATAEYMCKKEQPTVYRVHENPDPEKLRIFAQFARPFGYCVDPGKPEDTAQLQAVLDGAKGDPLQRVLPTLLLRSLSRARYADTCIGHYGLKAKYYLHFTSPIRRYPDLIAHRMLQKSLMSETFGNADFTTCAEAAEQSSAREYSADTAERDIDKLFLACYMKQFLGQEFDSEISGVQSFGVFVALDNGCEGLVRVEWLQGDYFMYDEPHMALIGKTSGQRYTIGTPLRVRLVGADETTGQIDFVPAGAPDPEQMPAREKPARTPYPDSKPGGAPRGKAGGRRGSASFGAGKKSGKPARRGAGKSRRKAKPKA